MTDIYKTCAAIERTLEQVLKENEEYKEKINILEGIISFQKEHIKKLRKELHEHNILSKR